MTSEIIDIFDVQIEAPEQFDVVVEQSEVNLEPLTITENGTYYPQGSATGFSKVEANVLPKSTDIVITENGEYYPNDYDVDAFSKVDVDVDVKPKLEDLTATDNGTYTPSEGFDGFGKVSVDLRGKVKVNSFTITNDCINEDGRWEGDVLIDTSNCTSFLDIFQGNTKIKQLDCQHWITNKVTSLQGAFNSCTSIKELDLSNWDTKNVTNITYLFNNCSSLETVDLRGWDMSNVITTASFLAAAYAFYSCPALKSLIGGVNEEEVISKNISCLNGLRAGIGFYTNPNIDRASLRAVINGLADLSNQDTLNFNIGENISKLTEEDIAIVINKNWTIV